MAKINLGKVVPEKGVDYFTESEIAQFKAAIESDLDSRLDTDEAQIQTNAGNIQTNSDAISALGTRMTTAEGNITTNAGNINTISGKVATLENDMTTAKSNIQTNAGDIDTLQQQQTVQDEAIQANTTALEALEDLPERMEAIEESDIEQNERIQELKAENESLIKTINNTTLDSTDTPSNNITLKDTGEGARLKKFVLKGKTEQESTNGYQLLNLNDTAGTIDGVNYTATDGIIKLTGTNTNVVTHTIFSQSSNLPNFEPGETYTIIPFGIDVLKNYVQINYNNGTRITELVSTQNSQIKTFTVPDDYQNTTLLIVNAKGTSTNHNEEIKIMLVKGSYTIDDTPAWEKYTGGIPSPNPNYPQEIRNVEGKNKLAYSLASLKAINGGGIWNDNKYTFNGIEYTINDDLTVKVNGTSSSTSYLLLNNDISLKQGENYILNGCPEGGGIQNHSIRLYDGNNYESQTGTDLSFVYGTQSIVRINVYGGITVDNLLFKPMISEKGGDYVPYNCIQIKKCNKNEYDGNERNNPNETINGTICTDTNSKWYSNVPLSSLKLPKTFSTYITANTYADSNIRITFFDANKTSLKVNKGTDATTTNKRSYIVLTQNDIPQNAEYISLGVRIKDGGYTEKTQIEDGEIVSDYIEHQEKTYNFPLSEGQKLMQDGKIEDKVVNEWGEYVFTGEEEIVKAWGSADKVFRIKVTLENCITFDSATTNIICKSNKFIAVNYAGDRESLWSLRNNNDYPYLISIRDSAGTVEVSQPFIKHKDINTVEDFSAYLAQQYANGTPVKIQYKLATPDETNFTPEQQSVIDEIIRDGTYDEVTYYSSNTLVNPDIEAAGIKDIRTLQNQIDILSSRVDLLEE